MTIVARLAAVQAELERRVADGAARHGVPGIAVGITLDGEEAYAFHGVTNLDHPLPVDAGTLFQIGSTTKTYTALAILRLAEAGRLDLDAPVRTYVPELRLRDEEAAARVTVFHLLNHTAGWTGDFFADTGLGDDALARYVERLADLEQLVPPGTVASYNNAAFSLAGRVIEKVTGGTYEDALQELVLDPLGLRETFVRPEDVMTRRFASGHQHAGDGVAVARRWVLPRSAWSAGGIVATAPDQVRYARFHLGEEMERMRQPTVDVSGTSMGTAIGISWMLADMGGVRVVRHGGATNGQLSAFAMVPERRFAIAVLTNADTGGLLHRDVVRWALEAYLDVSVADPSPVAAPPERLCEYAGRYVATNGTYVVTVAGDRLAVRVAYSERGLDGLRSFHGAQVPKPATIRLEPLEGDGFLAMDGPGAGTRGCFLRREGAVWALHLGGRLCPREEAGSG